MITNLKMPKAILKKRGSFSMKLLASGKQDQRCRHPLYKANETLMIPQKLQIFCECSTNIGPSLAKKLLHSGISHESFLKNSILETVFLKPGTKFLGVCVDENPSWKEHINTISYPQGQFRNLDISYFRKLFLNFIFHLHISIYIMAISYGDLHMKQI